jgi:hypothetical protein
VVEVVTAVQVDAPVRGPKVKVTPLGERWTFRSLSAGGRGVALTDAAAFGPAKLGLERVTATSVDATVSVAPGAPGLVLLRRPYLPGYRARLDGRELELGLLDSTFVGVVVPAGARGRMRIDYAPLGVRAPGVACALSAALLLAAGLLREGFRRKTGHSAVP